VVLLKWRSSSGASRAGNRALDILKERYAKGELTREQFRPNEA
jgi:uncharacterized membrane protein